jgi:hypothetical protein
MNPLVDYGDNDLLSLQSVCQLAFYTRNAYPYERFGLASRGFLRHVQQEFLVIRFHFRK